MSAINIIFREIKGTPDLVFAEIENDDGESINIGEWDNIPEIGTHKLRIELHPTGGVCIPNVTREELLFMCRNVGKTPLVVEDLEENQRWCDVINRVVSALSPQSEEPSSLGDTAITSGKLYDSVFPSPAKAEITLTENTVGNVLTDENLLFVATFLDRYTVGRGGYEAIVLRAIATLILTKLTPPMEELKVDTDMVPIDREALVRAWCGKMSVSELSEWLHPRKVGGE